MTEPKKSLGQHWLRDAATLKYIVDQAKLKPGDAVLEIGPGLGTLTQELLGTGADVVAVEKDEQLAVGLRADERLRVVSADILSFDLNAMPPDYKVVANIPYYLTSNLIRVLSESTNSPSTIVLLVQKEVAERLCAEPGAMSLLSVSAQLYYDCQLGEVVPARLFEPAPKVDSQVIILSRHSQPLFEEIDTAKFFRLVKAGFSERRKKLRSSLSGGLSLPKDQVDELLKATDISPDMRAQQLSLQQWYQIYRAALPALDT